MATTSVPHWWKYNVFVSFRGEDIRKTFMDHLFNDFKQKGIHAFRDDRDLPKAETISPHLYKAIEESRFLIVIFSKNYASSTLCRRELVKILECKQIENPKHEVRIIFYDAKPDVREALSMAAEFSGWDLHDMTNGFESKFINKISNDIFKMLHDGPLYVGENLVGVDILLDRLNLSRFVGSNKVNMIGICGISGIGKTTLAKAVYNSMHTHFYSSCFCDNVQGVEKQQGLTQDQMQMIGKILKTKDLMISSIAEGGMIIKQRMACKPILVVFDDVDDHKQLDSLAGSPSWFCPGSLIIFTGKDKQLLMSHGVDEIHDMKFLDEHQSLQLFGSYAFKTKEYSRGFKEIAEEVVKYVQGHPLAIAREIIHEESIMSGKHRRLWNSSEVYNVSSEKMLPMTEAIEVPALLLRESSQNVHINANSFALMKNLRILKIYAKEEFPQKLEWKGYDVNSIRKTLLRLTYRIATIKHLWTIPKCFRRLKFMKLRYCLYLTSTPDFTDIGNLEELILEGYRYLQIVASIEQYSDLSEMTLEEAIGRLKTYEERIKYKKGKQVDNQEKLMFTRYENKGKYFRGRGRGKHRFLQGRNHENFKEEKKDKETSRKNFNKNNFKKSNYDTSKLQCYKYKKRHIAPKCPQRTKPNEQSNLVKEDLEPTLLMAILEDEEQKVSLHEEDVGYKETNKDSLWHLDNGANNHMTGVKEHFKELNEKVSGKVRFEDGSYIEIKGKGSFLIECDDEKQRIISHVYYILDLKSNLLSLRQFTEIGCKVVMEDDELRLYDIDNKTFMKATRQRNRIYKENLRICTLVCLLANLKDDTWLWHARLGHLNFEAPFPKKAKARSTSPLDLVYGDLCGPITPPTPSGKKYIFLLVDDYSRYMWVYFLNTKDQAFDTFKEYKKSIENELGTTLKMLRTDRGGEFTSNEFMKYCKENSIARQLTAPYSPQQNGAEAVRHAIYILNSVPTKALEDITPYEAIKRRKPNLENLRVFGCITYAKVPSQHLAKLDDKSTRMELLLAEDEPKNYKEASSDQKWIEAMKAELDSINRNNTWKLTTLPKGHKAIGLKWVFKTKRDANGNIIKHKARLVAKGYIQEHGIDFEEVFAPIGRMETIRLLLAIAANNKWEVHHLDVKSAFLHGDLKEEVYVTQPEGFVKKQDQGKVYRLIKSLYGLRQAPRAWNIKLDNTLKSLGFKKCALEQAIYTKTSKDSTLLIGVYVDDLIITGTPKKKIDKFKAQMEEKSEMSDLGLLAYYLGIEVTEGTMVNSTEYRSIIGYLRYLLHTRPDLSYSVGLLSHFMQEPREQHMKAIRQVLRYVKGTKDHGITYKHNGGNKIHGYSDSSYGVNTQEGKGTTGIIFYYGKSPISWSTQKQATVALSSCESEFIAATAAATQALWLKRLLSKLTHSEEDKVTIKVDNKYAIALIKNPVFHRRSKHIDTKYHFIRECVERKDIQVEFKFDPTLSGCLKLDKLPEDMGRIKSLTELHIDGTSITGFPLLGQQESILARWCPFGWLTKQQHPERLVSLAGFHMLKDLNFSYCNLVKVPESIGGLSCLKELDFRRNNFSSFLGTMLVGARSWKCCTNFHLACLLLVHIIAALYVQLRDHTKTQS
uniref:Ribonuclease H-like domain, reverse transcriptase, RNA-dependent DNA polymerase n=1 Tax=Tanacetum cinerariifolium TaxID=118510 RepID=A0A6L2KM67_TANCI|nr:ribonuclease H-like domain, reverse transcriptase, RNA-dependent DNA polymerase [Tanacetum cinerariifolium]